LHQLKNQPANKPPRACITKDMHGPTTTPTLYEASPGPSRPVHRQTPTYGKDAQVRGNAANAHSSSHLYTYLFLWYLDVNYFEKFGIFFAYIFIYCSIYN
jgi:hypothetical protein